MKPSPVSGADDLCARLAESLGSNRVRTDGDSLRLYSQDVYRSGEMPLAVVSPQSVAEVATAVSTATSAGVAVFVRGGGMSYTDAYLPDRPDAILLDLAGLNQIREINAEDLYATVEAGCTWAELDAALEPHGVRAVFWGPMSGRIATVGGGMSQGTATFGSGIHGTSSAAALGFEIITADGRKLVTGSGGQPPHSDFFREYGPDLTGLFTGDAGALGVKTAITLRLEPRPKYGDGLSFAFDDFARLCRGVQAVARAGAATEVFGAETALARSVADASTFKSDFKTLLSVGKAAGNPLTGAKRMLSIAANGRRFLKDSRYTISFLAEGHTRQALKAQLRAIRAAVGNDGYEIPNTMAVVTRANPFPDPMVLGPGGRRLLPMHGIVPYSAANALHANVEKYIATQKEACERLGIDVFLVYATLGRSSFLYELVIYWPDDWNMLHKATLPDDLLSLMQEGEVKEETRQLVDAMKTRFVDIMYDAGSTHLQIGRLYPYARDRNPAALALLRQIKQEVDPAGLINPGALGI